MKFVLIPPYLVLIHSIPHKRTKNVLIKCPTNALLFIVHISYIVLHVAVPYPLICKSYLQHSLPLSTTGPILPKFKTFMLPLFSKCTLYFNTNFLSLVVSILLFRSLKW